MRALQLLVVLGLACSASPRAKVAESVDVAPTQLLVLSVQAPSGEGTPATVTGAPQVLQVELTQIDNPSHQAFTIAVLFVSASAAPGQTPVGAVAPFPSDQPGRLSLLVPPAVQTAIAASPAPPRFRLLLQPVATDRSLVAPLQATVALRSLGPG